MCVSRRIIISTAVVTACAASAAYWTIAVPRMRSWGTKPCDRQMPLPGDEVVSDPQWTMNLAVSVQAPPASIWPWLVQIGYQRGGLYSYDWLDRLFGILDRPSANQILPEFQHLQAGDVIPLGAGPDWPVASVDPGRSLVLAPVAPGVDISWAFKLDPLDTHTTRLITRVRAKYARSWSSALIPIMLDPTAFLMTRKMLLGIKARAESNPPPA